MTSPVRRVHLDLVQSVRRLHCAREGEEHKCVGTCTIKPDGVDLACTLCGTEKIVDMRRKTEIAQSIFWATGMQFDSLSSDAQTRVLDQIRDGR